MSSLASAAGLDVGPAGGGAVGCRSLPPAPVFGRAKGELFAGGVSERGAASLGGGVPPSTFSTLTLFPPDPPIAARTVSRATSVALTGVGSTSPGSPTFVARATSGCFMNIPVSRPNVPVSRRLASSALFWATAALVGLGIGWCNAPRRFLASSTRSMMGYRLMICE